MSQPKTRWAILAKTFSDGRDTCIEGESGLLTIMERYGAVRAWNRSNGEMLLDNNSRIKIYSSEEPKRLRGPQHHGAWVDELASYENFDAWDQLQFGLRLGNDPRTVVTTTPRPIPIIKDLLTRETTLVTRGSTFENAENLAESALLEFQRRYAGTRLGQQELFGEILDDVPGALFHRELIETARISPDSLPPLMRVVIGIDPAVTSGEDSDNTGIIAAGMTADGNYYILEDATIKASPQVWATKAVALYEKHQADRVIAEVNNGGDLVIHLLQQVNPNIPAKKVTASRGKAVRAEPIAALYEQGRVHHVGYFGPLEDEMCQFVPGETNQASPDRMDAMVWALTELTEASGTMSALGQMAKYCPSCRFPNLKRATHCAKCFAKLTDEILNPVSIGRLQ